MRLAGAAKWRRGRETTALAAVGALTAAKHISSVGFDEIPTSVSVPVAATANGKAIATPAYNSHAPLDTESAHIDVEPFCSFHWTFVVHGAGTG